ncbi:FGGY family carbohydrate kinase [Bifidobacterium sp. ESL0690]|uniref:xylulokinase n=1 Tax=Bifidobacterium sp. ESL0690 TaxID=2983214 RepID=UPI0023F94CBE|nr:FGGY family carbohydrate kinase [Bifidobacterium sp. ESL0690]WEV46882.1 FGGY family carbohydrate kinase [Bifidobacterium sp. ESL0690]
MIGESPNCGSRKLVAGVDTSTQSTKVRVTDAATGELVRFGKAKHPVGTSVDPEYWWQAFLKACEEAGGLDDVSAISVGGQQHGLVLLDRSGRVIRDAILWDDTRSAPQSDEIIRTFGAIDDLNHIPKGPWHTPMVVSGESAHSKNSDDCEATKLGTQRWVHAIGSAPVTCFTISKLAWVAEYEPENAARIAAICLPHDWLSWRIAGFGPVDEGEDAHLEALVTDRSEASGTGYFDAANNRYLYNFIDMVLGRHDIILPKVLGPREASPFRASAKVAGSAIDDGCIIGPGGGDNEIAAFGLNMVAGDASISLGTSAVAEAVAPEPVYDLSGMLAGYAECTGHYLPEAGTLNGSRILDAGCKLLSVGYEELSSLALSSVPGAKGLTLLPYFDGEYIPIRPNANAALSGMTLSNTTPENVARAFVEALLCSVRDCLELIKQFDGGITRILLIGGGAKSKAVRVLAPAIFEMPVTIPAEDEYVAIGAARQAAWVLSGEEEPPQWKLKIEAVQTGTPTPEVYESYAKVRGDMQ